MQVQLTAVFKKVPQGYIGFVEELPGANTQGATLEEARANLMEAIQMVLEANRTLAQESLEGQDVIREPVTITATLGLPEHSADGLAHMAITETVQKCRIALQRHYGPQFEGLVLYGSVARDQATPDSDIDLLVLLSKPFDYFQELRQIVDLLYPIQLESDRLLSTKPAPVDEFEAGSIQLYRNAKREGILV
jgi:predicted RNase H-like HicB family nuclease/predicted nucleotidyltransferase